MNTTIRTIIATATALIVIAAIYFSMPIVKIKPQGIVLPAETLTGHYSGDVKLYDSGDAPIGSRELGFISVEYHVTHLSNQLNQLIIEKAKTLAANAGGDGLVYNLGHSVGKQSSPMKMIVLKGYVVKTPYAMEAGQ